MQTASARTAARIPRRPAYGHRSARTVGCPPSVTPQSATPGGLRGATRDDVMTLTAEGMGRRHPTPFASPPFGNTAGTPSRVRRTPPGSGPCPREGPPAGLVQARQDGSSWTRQFTTLSSARQRGAHGCSPASPCPCRPRTRRAPIVLCAPGRPGGRQGGTHTVAPPARRLHSDSILFCCTRDSAVH